jgi:hypothetical protein
VSMNTNRVRPDRRPVEGNGASAGAAVGSEGVAVDMSLRRAWWTHRSRVP